MEADEKPPIAKLRYITKYPTVEAADADKKRLDIYDAEFDLSKAMSGLQGMVASSIPQHLREWFIRRKIKMGITWETKLIDGEVNFIFCPSGPLMRGLQAKANFGWIKLALDTQKKFKELLGYEVRIVFVDAEPGLIASK